MSNREIKSEETVVIIELPEINPDLKDHVYMAMSGSKFVINLKFPTKANSKEEDKIISEYLEMIINYLVDGINYRTKTTYVYSKVEEDDGPYATTNAIHK